MIKRSFFFLFIVLFILLAYGCARQAPSPAEASKTPSPSISISPSVSPPNNQPVTDFLQDMLSWKNEYWGKIEAKYKDSDYASFFNTLNAPDYLITILPMYDILSLNGNNGGRVEGKLMLSGIPAYKEMKDGILSFGFDYTYEEETYLYPQGAVEKAAGKLDTQKKLLQYEDTVSLSGQAVSRTVLEIKKTSDGGYIYQYLFAQYQKPLTGVWSCINSDAYAVAAGSKQGGLDFTYTSIPADHCTLDTLQNGFEIGVKASAGKNDAAVTTF